jgi:hypothetical protein
MRKALSMVSVASVFGIVALTAPVTFAQSSGSFNYSNNPLQCVVNQQNGTLSGGIAGNVTTMSTTMKTSSGNGNVFVVTPSAVVGLVTDVTISSKQQGNTVSSSSQAGVDFTVTATPLSNQPAPVVIPSGPVTYEDRFIQISTNLFTAIASQCLANPDGTGGCFLTFNESTLGAHSFNWVITNLQAGSYGLTVKWSPSSLVQGLGNVATCVGPVNLTVTQNKVFTPSTGVSF